MKDDVIRCFKKRTEKYNTDYSKYGYSPFSLEMPSDRRNIRYYEMIKNLPLLSKKDFILCDAGCGFGDINGYFAHIGITNYTYIGLDVVDAFLEEGRSRYGSEKVKFYNQDFTRSDLSSFSWDYAVSSQAFNSPYGTSEDNYQMMFASVERLFRQCSANGAVSFNFFNSNVDFRKENSAYYDPARVLTFAYSLSRNVILDNSCMPFETTVTIFKNDTFDKAVFSSFYAAHAEEFASGLFQVLSK